MPTSTEKLDQALCQAIQQRIDDIAEEEVKAAIDRVRDRIKKEVAGAGPEILRRMNWSLAEGEVIIKFRNGFLP